MCGQALGSWKRKNLFLLLSNLNNRDIRPIWDSMLLWTGFKKCSLLVPREHPFSLLNLDHLISMSNAVIDCLAVNGENWMTRKYWVTRQRMHSLFICWHFWQRRIYFLYKKTWDSVETLTLTKQSTQKSFNIKFIRLGDWAEHTLSLTNFR